MLEKKYGDRLDEAGQSYLQFISSSANRMSNLIHDLLNYTEIGQEHQFESVDFNFLFQEVMSDLHALREESNAIFTTSQLLKPVAPRYIDSLST